MVISVEGTSDSLDSFWQNDVLIASLANICRACRIRADHNPKAFSEFTHLFPPSGLPSIFVFGAFSRGPSLVVAPPMPSPGNFAAAVRRIAFATGPLPHVRVSVFAGGQIHIRSFNPTETVDDVRLWVAAEVRSPSNEYDIAIGCGTDNLPAGRAPLSGFGPELVLRLVPRPKAGAVTQAIRMILAELSAIGGPGDDPAEFWRARTWLDDEMRRIGILSVSFGPRDCAPNVRSRILDCRCSKQLCRSCHARMER
jgi:hypothetical protein